MVTFSTNAWSSGSTDGDVFDFAWSTDNSNFTYMFTVSSTDNKNVQSAVIPSSGVLYIRVTDTDQTANHKTLDSITVDHMFVRGDNSVPEDPPAAPQNLQLSSIQSNSITLLWQHDGVDEQSFELQRRAPAGSGVWGYLDDVTGGSTGYTDTTVLPLTSYEYRINASNAAGISAWSNSAGGTTPAASSIVLGANGYKVKGIHNIDLNWSGTTGDVEVIRDGLVITSVTSGSSYTDNTDKKGSATYVYKVCNSDPASCSADVVIVF